MPNRNINRELLEKWETARETGNCERYYEALFVATNFNRPPNLGKVKIRMMTVSFDAAEPGPLELISQFQEFLMHECAKQDFTERASCVPGWFVEFLNGKLRVFLHSAAWCPPSEEWMEAYYAPTSP